jgi:hypothetical protein
VADEVALVKGRVVGAQEVVPGPKQAVVIHLEHTQKKKKNRKNEHKLASMFSILGTNNDLFVLSSIKPY